jgi:transcriptional regulator with XRE-family HTH domain
MAHRLTQGAVEFGLVAEKAPSQEAFAKQLGTTQSNVSRLKRGQRLPGRDLALRIKTVCGIAPESWSQPSRKRVPAVKSRAPALATAPRSAA